MVFQSQRSQEFLNNQVYNQNGDGYVCLHEFIEAHGILQIALRLNPKDDEDPPVLRGDLHNLFAHVIGDSEAWQNNSRFVFIIINISTAQGGGGSFQR